MTRQARAAAAVLALLSVVTGCGSAASSEPGVPPEAPPGGAALLATSLVTAAGTWAVAVMGGSVATHNNFWQLFVRPAGGTRWKLVTPPGVPDNGGLVVAGAGGQSLITGFRPSQYLTYTPLAVTRDGGRAWAPTGPLGGALADVPDALAAAPGRGELVALLASGAVQTAAPGYTHWHVLTGLRTVAGSAAGRRCDLRTLTAITVTTAGLPVLGGSCGRPGASGIFIRANGAWREAGPALPGALAREQVTVLRLTQAGGQTAALLRAGAGNAASVLAARSTGDGRWIASPPLRLTGGKLTVGSFGPAETVVLNGTTAAATPSAGGTWRSLPAVPAGTATVAPGPTGGFDALAVHRGQLTIWQLGAGASAWRTIQVIKVPIQYGSSG